MELVEHSELVKLHAVKINDSFWSEYLDLTREVVIPYQWDALNDNIADAEPSHAIKKCSKTSVLFGTIYLYK